MTKARDSCSGIGIRQVPFGWLTRGPATLAVRLWYGRLRIVALPRVAMLQKRACVTIRCMRPVSLAGGGNGK
jgi:hypothetical protein